MCAGTADVSGEPEILKGEPLAGAKLSLFSSMHRHAKGVLPFPIGRVGAYLKPIAFGIQRRTIVASLVDVQQAFSIEPNQAYVTPLYLAVCLYRDGHVGSILVLLVPVDNL